MSRWNDGARRHHQGVDGHRNNLVDWTPNSRERRAHAASASKEGCRAKDLLWAVSWSNKVWFFRSNNAVGRWSKKGYHARCSVGISSTWHPSHVWSHHQWTHKWDQPGEERGGLGSTLRGTWSLPRGIGCYEAPHTHIIRCVLAGENWGRCPKFHSQDSKRNMAHLLIQCMKITNREKRTKLKET